MKLYEIEEAISACIDWETGEIADPERFEELQIEKEVKLENIALYIKNLKAEVEALKAEKESFAERERITKNKITNLESYLSKALNGKKFETNRVVVSFRESESVDVVEVDKIPKKYMRKKIEYSPDKMMIKEAIKNGLKVRGCALIKKKNINVK